MPLYSRTYRYLDILNRYSKGKLNLITTQFLRDLLANEILPQWRVIGEPTIEKYLKKIKSSFNTVLKDPSKDKTEDSLDKKLFNEIESLEGLTFKGSEKDKEASEILHPSKKKKKMPEVKEIDPKEYSKTSSVLLRYNNSILGKINRIASYTRDPLIKTELLRIYNRLRGIL